MTTQNLDRATQLYETVKVLSQDLRSADIAKAYLVIEYAEDAIKAFGDTNQDKKVELGGIIKSTQEIIPPNTFRDLNTTVQSKLLKLVYPKNPKLRNILFVVVAIVIIASAFLTLRTLFPTFSQSGNGNTSVAQSGSDIRALSSEDIAKLQKDEEGTSINGADGEIDYKIYNGSDWTIKEITLRVVAFVGTTVYYDENIAVGLAPGSDGKPAKVSLFRRESALDLENIKNIKRRNGLSGIQLKAMEIISARGIKE